MVVKLKDLVVLVFASNNCYTNVQRADSVHDEHLVIDSEKCSWSYHHWKDMAIGRARFMDNWKDGVIGVYNSRDIRHLNQMVRDATHAVDNGNALNMD